MAPPAGLMICIEPPIASTLSRSPIRPEPRGFAPPMPLSPIHTFSTAPLSSTTTSRRDALAFLIVGEWFGHHEAEIGDPLAATPHRLIV